MAVPSVHLLYEQGRDSRPHGCAHIRLLRPLLHPANQMDLRITHGREYRGADIVIVERTWKYRIPPDEAQRLVQRIRSDRAVFIYTIDDDLLDLPDVAQLSDHRTFTRGEATAVRDYLRQADGVIVSTEALRDRLARMNPRIVVVPNALDERLFTGRGPFLSNARARDGKRTIGFMGTLTHDVDLMMVLQPLREILRRHRGTVEFEIAGVAADRATVDAFQGLPVRILDVGPYADYPLFVRWMIDHIRWDLAIAPLEDNGFNRCKSDIKFLDYSALGIPGMYSRVSAYERTVRHLETGYLADNTPAAWAEGLERLLADDALRERIADAAERFVRETRMLEHCAHAWRDAILDLAQLSGALPLQREDHRGTDSSRLEGAQERVTSRDATPPVIDWNLADVSDNGERVTHLFPNDCYYAHLSLYRFASQFCKEGEVLDAGCGTGYGSAYLVDRAARSVVGIDVSAKAIAFSRCFFQRTGLTFLVMDLANISGFPENAFDLIIASNVLEHLAEVPSFLRTASNLLRPQGVAAFAMPPITSAELKAADFNNPFHLNSWSPRQWYAALGEFFSDVQPYGHYFNKPGYPLDFANSPAETAINEMDFLFAPITVEDFDDCRSLTALFVARGPRPQKELAPAGSAIHFVDDSISVSKRRSAIVHHRHHPDPVGCRRNVGTSNVDQAVLPSVRTPHETAYERKVRRTVDVLLC